MIERENEAGYVEFQIQILDYINRDRICEIYNSTMLTTKYVLFIYNYSHLFSLNIYIHLFLYF